MMLLDVRAAWLASSAGMPVTAGAVLGLAFNVKLFEALLIVPALIVLIAMTSAAAQARRLRRRARRRRPELDRDLVPHPDRAPAVAIRLDRRLDMERRVRLQRRSTGSTAPRRRRR